jgi:hypothetical protein
MVELAAGDANQAKHGQSARAQEPTVTRSASSATE